MKILILQDDFPPHHAGGAGTVAYEMARGFLTRGHEVRVITTVRSTADAGNFNEDGLQIYRIACRYDRRFQAYFSLWNRKSVKSVETILEDFKPDVVHAHNVHGYLSYASLKAAKRSGAKVILTCHDVMPFNYGKFVQYIDPSNLAIPEKFDYRIDPWRQLKEERFRYNPLRNFFIRKILRENVDVLVAVSEALRQALQENYLGDAEVVYNGIDAAAWQVAEGEVGEFRKKHDIGNHALFFTGKPFGVKGAYKLFAAVKDIVQKIPDTQVLVVGREDEHTERLRIKAKELGIEDRIIFTGWLQGRELISAYRATAVVTVPSLCFDSFPTVNLEAFACKKPVIATCFGGSQELVEDGVSGYIVNPFDTTELSVKLFALLSSPERQRLFGNAGNERIIRDFSIERQIGAYEQIFLR